MSTPTFRWIGLMVWAVLVLATRPIAAQQVRLNGLVLDADDASPLPFATIQVEGGASGTVTNRSGEFFLIVQKLPAVIVVRFIGYHTKRVTITEQPTEQLVIRLEPSSVELDELVVSGENPALPILRKVLEKKRAMRAGLRSTYADVYTRFMLYSGFDLVQMRESVRASWWTPTGGTREVLRAERVRPIGSGTFRFASAHPVPNFYDDDIDVLGTRYAGPTHPDAERIYRYTLGGQRELDGRSVYDLYFSPVSPTRPAFSGHMAVLDSSFVILEITARPHPGTLVTPPVLEHDVHMEQRFAAVSDSMWLPLDLFVAGTVDFGRAGVSYPTARYEQLSSLSLHAVNPPVPDSLKVPGPPMVRDPLAAHQDHLFIRSPSMIPLTPRELEQMATLDPKGTVRQAFRPEGLLAAYTAVDVDEEQHEEEEGPIKTQFDLVERVVQGDWFWFNRVDGWHPGFGYGSSTESGIQWKTSLGYSTLRKRLSYDASINIPWGKTPLRGYVGLSATDGTAVTARSDVLGRFVPGLMNYVGYDDLYNYYHRRALGANIDLIPGGLPLIISFRTHWETHASLARLTHHDGWLWTNEPRENPPIGAGDLRSGEIAVTVGDRDKAAVELSVERSPGSSVDSDYEFTRIEGRATVGLRTFYRNRARPNRLRLTVMGGTRTGELPVQRKFTLVGSAGPYSEFAGFRTLSNSRFISSQLVGFFWAHDFTTAPFEKLGLWWLAERGMGLHLFGGHAFTLDESYTDRRVGRYHELGVGLTYPFGLPFRIDVARGTDRTVSFRIGRTLN